MAEPRDDGILHEIDDELRQEHYAKLWKRYGNYVIGAALLLVVGVAGYKGWQHYDVTSRRELAERFAAAMNQQAAAKHDAAAQAFAKIAADGRAGYAMLARFQEASLASKQGDKKKAAEQYARIGADQSVEPLYRELAVLLSAMNEFETAPPDKIKSALQPIAEDGKPWRFSARELIALAEEKAGRRDEAAKLFKALAADPEAPQGVRARAGDFAQALGAKQG